MLEILPKEKSPLLREKPLYPVVSSYYKSKRQVREFIDSFVKEKKENDREQYLMAKFKTFFAKQTPLFYQIQIETCSFCNEKCAFCPANIHDDIRGKNFMPEEIFNKIIDNLVELNFTGMISLFNNNEPLIDKRLEKFVKICKDRLPKAKTEIITNGSLINFKRFEDLYLAGLDSLVIDNYYKDENKPELVNAVKKFMQEFEASPYKNKMYIPVFMRFQKEILTNRAGNAPNKKDLKPKESAKKFCAYPFMQFNVNYAGKVNLCCNDVYYQGVVGDITQNSIKDIWESKLYGDIRKKIMAQDRNHGICANCDAVNNLHGPVESLDGHIAIPEYINGERED